jgi:hypothetical protein
MQYSNYPHKIMSLRLIGQGMVRFVNIVINTPKILFRAASSDRALKR